MGINRFRKAALPAAALVVGSVVYPPAGATDYPTRPVRFIVPYPPGGGADTLARIVTKGLSTRWNQSVVVDNRPGADATIGVNLTAQSPADAHTMVLIITSHAVHPALRKLPYDLERDLAPVSNVLEGPAVLVVHPGLKVNAVSELISLAKSREGKLNFGAPGVGGPGHLSGIMFNQLAGVKTTHVPYKGAAAVVTALVSGEVQFMFATVLSGMPHVTSGRLKALAVTSAKRSPIVPELPTMIEAGLDNFESVTWYGIVTRAGSPAAAVSKAHNDILAVVKTPDVAKQLTSQGVQIVGMNPAQFTTHLRAEIKKWALIVKQANMQDIQAN